MNEDDRFGEQVIALKSRQCSIILRSLALFYILLCFMGLAFGEIVISGAGFGELLLNFTIQDTVPVFSGGYSFDLEGIHIPPIEDFSVATTTKKGGYGYSLPGIYIPGKPNDFTVSASNVKNLNIGLKKDQGSYENSSMVWKHKYTRTWITSQTEADNSGTAAASSDLLSPGSYQIKIFGDAAQNASEVNLTMTLIKKMIVKGRFSLSVNMTGFPSGSYKLDAKAINGSVRLDEIGVEGVSL